MLPKNLFVIIACLLGSCAEPASKNPHVVIETKAGKIEVELYPEQAPRSVAAFLAHVDSGLYRNASFYRVLNVENQPSNAPKAELVQGGLWRTNYKLAKTLPRIPHETTEQTGLSHKSGTVSFARGEPGSAGTEFFICIGDQPGFDFGGENNPDGQGYAAFGKVVKGMNVVRTIYKQPEEEQYFTPPVFIFNIKRR